jgi:hypothetical protein
MFSGYDETNEIAQEEKAAKKRQKKLEGTKPRKAYRYEENFADDSLGLKPHRHTENFVQDLSDTQPVKTVLLPGPREAIEKGSFEEMKLRKAIKILSPKKRGFSWAAFFVMLISIGTALLVGTLIPGLLDEILAAIVISAVNAFISAHRNK